jgi:hypothetical protein
VVARRLIAGALGVRARKKTAEEEALEAQKFREAQRTLYKKGTLYID